MRFMRHEYNTDAELFDSIANTDMWIKCSFRDIPVYAQFSSAGKHGRGGVKLVFAYMVDNYDENEFLYYMWNWGPDFSEPNGFISYMLTTFLNYEWHRQTVYEPISILYPIEVISTDEIKSALLRYSNIDMDDVDLSEYDDIFLGNGSYTLDKG